ncbi:substrate-binding domain-containing protein [Pseudomonas sp. MOB-449]|nr:substrate-binding domain-containing protein [Pseudomonas sp. MOB-449]
MKKRKTSVIDVAKAAGVSVATVSRAYNLPHLVRDGVREQVLKTAQDLGYTPNPAAKALRMQKSMSIGVVIPSLNYSIFARLVESFQETMTKDGYSTFVLTTGFNNGVIFEPVRKLIDQGVDGLLMVGRIDDEALRSYVLEKQLPCVTTYSYTGDPDIPSIGFDNFAATRKVVELLLQLGHTHLAMFAGPVKGNDRQQERIRAFNDVVTTHGLSDNCVVIERDYSDAPRHGAEVLRTLREQYPDITAVVCNSDIFAFSVISESRKLGLSVPRDLSVTGFEDDVYTSLFEPALTTIAVPARELGQCAALEMLKALKTGQKIPSVRLETQLIVRDSTSRPPTPR